MQPQNLHNGTMFGGITSVFLVDLLVGMHAGATMIPELGFWHSAPESMHMAECPNQQACMGDRLSLHACQTAAYAAPALNGSTQVFLPPASPSPQPTLKLCRAGCTTALDCLFNGEMSTPTSCVGLSNFCLKV